MYAFISCILFITTTLISCDKDLFRSLYVGTIPSELRSFLEETGSCNSLLLYGEPGTGKTQLARSFAKASNREFLYISGGTIVNSYQGSGSKTIKDIFERAYNLILEEHKKVVICIDEIDGFAQQRKKDGSIEHANALLALLAELDVIRNDPRIYFFSTTNKYAQLDDAFLSRMQHKVEIKMPVESDRLALLSHYLYCQPFISQAILQKLSYKTKNISIRDIKTVIDLAQNNAFLERNSPLLIYKDFLDPLKTVKEEAQKTKKDTDSIVWLKQNALPLAGLSFTLVSFGIGYMHTLESRKNRKEDLLSRKEEVGTSFYLTCTGLGLSVLGLCVQLFK